MKGLFTIVSLFVSAVVVAAQGPYPPSGWRPDGPALELPQRNPQKQEYLPPLDPRNAATPGQEYGPPEVDVSVQGLPTQEQLPIFQMSPINGQQYVGPDFNKDLKNLDQRLKQSQLQFQAQQEAYRQLARQRQAQANQDNQKVPRQFVPRTTARPTEITYTDEARTTQAESTTEGLTEADLNEGEAVPAKQTKERVSVEVSKQKVQEFPPELFLRQLAQLNLQSQYAPLQLGQIRAPVYFQPAQGVSQKQVAAYDAATHLAALPSILAQQQLLQSQAELIQSQRQVQNQPGFQNPAYIVPQLQSNPASIAQDDQQIAYQPVNQYETLQPQLIQPQRVVFQSQVNQIQSNYPQQTEANQDDRTQPQFVYQYQQNQVSQVQPEQTEDQDQNQPQFVYQQYQPQYQQPQPNPFQVTQVQAKQPENQDQNQPQFVYQKYQPQYQQQQPNSFQVIQVQPKQPEDQDQDQPQLVYQQSYPQYQIPQYQPQQPLVQQGFPQQVFQQQVSQPASQGQGSLQSGLDVNQQGNGVDETEDKDDDENDGVTATAVATAFGSRTQPRVYSTYGVPSAPKVQANPGYQPTTEAASQDEATDDTPAVAEATAVAKAGRRKSSKLRSRRVRPVFTLDRSGHLVLAQEQ